MSGQFSVEVDALRGGGVDIDKISMLCHTIGRDLYFAVNQYAGAGGDGEIGKAMKANYEPARDSSLEFLGQLGQSLAVNGARTVELGNLMGNVDAGATGIANGSGGKVH